MLKKFILLLTFSIALPFIVSASPDGEHTEMETSMEHMDDAYKDLRRALRDASPEKLADYQALMEKMIQEAKNSRELIPQKVETVPEAEQAAMIEGFQKEMDGLITELERISGLLEAGNFDEVGTALRDLRGIKSDGHKKYKIEE